MKKKEVSKLIKDASRDLDELYCRIKKSNKILKYQNNGMLLAEIYINIISNFSLMQILETSNKSKMIHQDTEEELTRKDRFVILVNKFGESFEFICRQHLELLDSKNE